MRRWLGAVALFSISGIVGIAVFWAPDRVDWPWVVPLGLLFGVVLGTLEQLWTRPGEFVRDLRRLTSRDAESS